MRELGQRDRRQLLAVARGAIESVLCRDRTFDVDVLSLSPGLCQTAAAFVTLRENGDVRGCVGRMRFDLPIWANVRAAAIDAAFEDPRFVPLTEAELPCVELEISVLEPPVSITDPASFEPGRHGIIIERGPKVALLLPQVATEMGWGAAEMLGAVCRKAGLRESAWREPSTRLRVFEATHFSEPETLEAPAPAVLATH